MNNDEIFIVIRKALKIQAPLGAIYFKTEIPISIFEILIIWLERSVLSLILAGLVALVLF